MRTMKCLGSGSQEKNERLLGNKVKIIAPIEAVDGMKKFITDAASMYK